MVHVLEVQHLKEQHAKGGEILVCMFLCCFDFVSKVVLKAYIYIYTVSIYFTLGLSFTLRLINKCLERSCFMGLVTDVNAMPSSDQFCRRFALDSQVTLNK